MFSENCFCSLNLVFYMLFVFFRTKKKIVNQTCSPCFPCFVVLLVFENNLQFSKTRTKQTLHLENKIDFQRTPKWCSPSSQKTFFKNSLQKQQPDRPYFPERFGARKRFPGRRVVANKPCCWHQVQTYQQSQHLWEVVVKHPWTWPFR